MGDLMLALAAPLLVGILALTVPPVGGLEKPAMTEANGFGFYAVCDGEQLVGVIVQMPTAARVRIDVQDACVDKPAPKPKGST